MYALSALKEREKMRCLNVRAIRTKTELLFFLLHLFICISLLSRRSVLAIPRQTKMEEKMPPTSGGGGGGSGGICCYSSPTTRCSVKYNPALKKKRRRRGDLFSCSLSLSLCLFLSFKKENKTTA